MQHVLNPLLDVYQTQIEASRQFSDIVFSGAEKIDRVVIEAARRTVDEQLRTAQSMASARDARTIANAQPSPFYRPDGTMTYPQEIMRILAEMQNEIGRSTQNYFEQINSYFENTMAPFQLIPGRGATPASNPMTGLFSVWESAMHEFTSLANRAMNTGRSTYDHAAAATRHAVNEAAEDITATVDNTVRAGAESYGRPSGQASNGHDGSKGPM